MIPGWYIIRQTSARCFRLEASTEAEAREKLTASNPKKGRVVQLVKFTTHFTWCVIEEKRQ